MKLYIKYMVSLRCKILVEEELKKQGLRCVFHEFGIVEILENLTELNLGQVKENLHNSGWELLDDKKSVLIEKIKTVIIEMIHHTEKLPHLNYSKLISEKLGYDYTYLANAFVEAGGTTIQQFIIVHKIERVKELLLYNKLTLKEIANRLDYSSVAHLSNQFKKVTGLSPSYFKQLRQKRQAIS